jgi:hypothetical protein
MEPVDFGAPATYRIIVQGTLSPEWSHRFAGMVVTPGDKRDGEAPRTELEGRLQDHAELFGVLDGLYGLHLPILLVELVNHPVEKPTDERTT